MHLQANLSFQIKTTNYPPNYNFDQIIQLKDLFEI